MNPIEHAAIDLDAPSTIPVRPKPPIARRPAVWLQVVLVTLGLALALGTRPSAPPTRPAPVAVSTGQPDLDLSDIASIGDMTTDDGTVVIAIEFKNFSRNPVTASDPEVVMAAGFVPISVQILAGTSEDAFNRRPGTVLGPTLVLAPQQHASVVITFHLACTATQTLSPYVQSISVTASSGAYATVRDLTPDLSELGSMVWSGLCRQ